MNKVLLFGANGFVGPYLAKEFEEHGYQVLVSDLTDAPAPLLQNNEYFSCNLMDSENIKRIVSVTKPDIIINLAAISSVGQSWLMPQKTISVNMVGSLNIFDAAKDLESPPKILAIGSSEEYAPSEAPLNEESPLLANNPYGISKVGQEQLSHIYADRFGLRVYSVRAFNHTGVGQTDTFVLPSFCKQVAAIEQSGKTGSIRVGNLDIKRDFSDVHDIVRAYRLIVESDYVGTVFNVGSGIAYSLNDLLESTISHCSQKVIVQVDRDRFRPSDNPIICCNNKKARELLGWQPKYQIKDTLEEMYQYYLSRSC